MWRCDRGCEPLWNQEDTGVKTALRSRRHPSRILDPEFGYSKGSPATEESLPTGYKPSRESHQGERW